MIMTLSLLPITIVPIKTFQNNKNRIKISHSLIHYWNADINKPLYIKAGAHIFETIIEEGFITKDEIFICEGLLQDLLLPVEERNFLAHFDRHSNTLTLGPIFGLLTEINENNETADTPHFRSIHKFCEELDQLTSDIGGFFYVFRLQDFSDDGIYGYYFQDGGWIKTQVPFPDVIYNRIHSRKLDSSKHFQVLKTKLLAKNIHLFNDQFLSKEKVANLLKEEDYLRPYLPETASLTENTLREMINRYPVLFLKPIHGSQGRNIIKLSSQNNGLLAELSTGSIKERGIEFSGFQPFFQWLQPFLKKRTYLVQQGIPLIKYKNNQLDFRILCQRNSHNSWKATSGVARVSANDQFVANIARGGQMIKPLRVLTSLSNRENAMQQLSLMKELAIEIASIISQKSDGLVGELGIDIGLDENGKPWIIEVNSKPSKNFEEETSKIRPSAKALLEYVIFLTFSGGNQ